MGDAGKDAHGAGRHEGEGAHEPDRHGGDETSHPEPRKAPPLPSGSSRQAAELPPPLSGAGSRPATDLPPPATALAADADPEPEPPALASLPARMAAFLVDLMVLLMADLAIGLVAAVALGTASVARQTFFIDGHLAVEQWTLLGSLAFTFLYFTAMHARGGQTLGKAFFDLEVRHSDYRQVRWGDCLLRTTGQLATLLTLGLGFLAAAGASGATLHDRIADTRVFRVQGTGDVRSQAADH